MSNAHNKSSPSTLGFLLNEMDEASITTSDDNGKSPLQLICIRPASADEECFRSGIINCLKLYLNTKPTSSANFLTTLQSFPPWLRDEAVLHPYVKSILNRKISNRFPTSILLLDGYFYIAIVICFSRAVQSHLKFSFGLEEEIPDNVSNFVAICFAGAIYFISREVSQIISTISLGTFRAWILNADNWLDVGVVSLLFYYCLNMKGR